MSVAIEKCLQNKFPKAACVSEMGVSGKFGFVG